MAPERADTIGAAVVGDVMLFLDGHAAAEPGRRAVTVAVCAGAGDTCLDDAVRGGVDAYVTADLRHHPASERPAGGGPALTVPSDLTAKEQRL